MSKPIEPPPQAKTEGVDHSRRRLLGMVKYVPPVVLGVISLQQAGCQPGPSCMPQACGPNGGPCGPNGMCGPPPLQNDPGTETMDLPAESVVDPTSST